MARVRAPAADGEILAVPNFDAIPALVAENRRKLDRDDVRIGGLPLRELRALAQREVLEKTQGAVLPGAEKASLAVTGHQPELSHPGVWVKNFALNSVARKLRGYSLHLIADTDTLKSTSLRLPVIPGHGPKAHLESLPFDTFAGEVSYECRPILGPELFRTVPERAAPLCANWGYEPLLPQAWKSVREKPKHPSCSIGEYFTAMRRHYEREWGCHNLELTVSQMSQTEAFARFARHILDDLPRFRESYNAALREYRESNRIDSTNHPATELAEGEAPFWVRTTACRRERATAASDVRQLRPRALTLTLFTRVCLGDFFIHGIGGGKYDEVTDAIIRDYFGIDPPAYQILSATLHLPLPAFASTGEDVKRAERRVRDLHWNPQVFVPPSIAAEVLERHAKLAANEPPYHDHAARKVWFHEFQQVKEQLRQIVADRVAEAEEELNRVRTEAQANAILKRRDYSWVLYPEETLRPFLQRFLEG